MFPGFPPFVENFYSSQFDCEMKFHRLNIAARVERKLEWDHRE